MVARREHYDSGGKYVYLTTGLSLNSAGTSRRLNRSSDTVSSDRVRSAWVYAGQGSQVLGMGKDLWCLPAVKAKLSTAKRVLGWSVEEYCNDLVKLNNTQYCQPCLFVVSCLLTDLLSAGGYQPDFVAGFSLGEYCALYAARVFDFDSGLYLIKRRAEIMANAPSGVMVALLGCDLHALAEQIRYIDDVEIVSDEQSRIVIAGTASTVKNVIAKLNPARSIPINVGKPFHTKLMQRSEQEFQSILDAIPFSTATIPVLSNSDPAPAVNSDLLKQRLRHHMTAKVLWDATVRRFATERVDRLIEVSPSKVLTNALQQSSQCFASYNFTKPKDLNKLADVPALKVLICVEK